jgi:hypothetical protein
MVIAEADAANPTTIKLINAAFLAFMRLLWLLRSLSAWVMGINSGLCHAMHDRCVTSVCVMYLRAIAYRLKEFGSARSAKGSLGKSVSLTDAGNDVNQPIQTNETTRKAFIASGLWGSVTRSGSSLQA